MYYHVSHCENHEIFCHDFCGFFLVKLISRINSKMRMKWLIFNCNAQCGNYGNSLSHFFDKNFVKVLVLPHCNLLNFSCEIEVCIRVIICSMENCMLPVLMYKSFFFPFYYDDKIVLQLD